MALSFQWRPSTKDSLICRSFGVFCRRVDVLILAGTLFGFVEFIRHALIEKIPATAGTVMIAALPVFLGFQMLVNAMRSLLDIQSVPSIPLCEKLAEKYPTNGQERL